MKSNDVDVKFIDQLFQMTDKALYVRQNITLEIINQQLQLTNELLDKIYNKLEIH